MKGLIVLLYVLLTFVLLLGLGFVDCLSPGYIYWTWFSGTLCGVLAPVTQRSVPFLEEHKIN